MQIRALFSGCNVRVESRFVGDGSFDGDDLDAVRLIATP
jgi:hypothetical protein